MKLVKTPILNQKLTEIQIKEMECDEPENSRLFFHPNNLLLLRLKFMK